MKRKLILLLLALITSLVITGAVAAQEEKPTQAVTTVMDVIETDERLTSFQTLVEAAILADNLNQDGPFTVFAPTDEAFAAFEAMREEGDLNLTNVVLYHVVNGRYNAAALAARSNLPTLAGERLYFNDVDDTMKINQMATISVADVQTSNGIVHIIDHVLLPTTVQNGNAGATIMDALAEDGRFETLTSLLTTAGLDDMLNNPNDTFTLFAPTDEAFANAPNSLLEKWTADPEGELNTILSYHIVGDVLYSDQIANDDYIPTWEGRPLRVTFDEQDGLLLNDQSLATPDMLTANGIIHAVDAVLVP